MMKEIDPGPELAALLARYDTIGGVIDYVFLECLVEHSAEDLHRGAALEAMAIIDRRYAKRAAKLAAKHHVAESVYRIQWDATNLVGEQVSFARFWGNDDAEPKRHGKNSWSIPETDGYKTAFFNPPYELRASFQEKSELFSALNRLVLGDTPERNEIFSWSTDWSSYFDAGHEWWGAFYWTIRVADSRRFVVIAASTTD